MTTTNFILVYIWFLKLILTNNSPHSNLQQHMDDPDFNDPPAAPADTASSSAAVSASISGSVADSGSSSASSSVSEESIAMIQSMGYTTEQATAALTATDNNLER
jgi:uncharacterized UBP type Zn finger protein